MNHVNAEKKCHPFPRLIFQEKDRSTLGFEEHMVSKMLFDYATE